MKDVKMKLLNSKEVKERLGGICHNTMRSFVSDGVLPEPKKLGGRLYWLESDVDSAVQNLMTP